MIKKCTTRTKIKNKYDFQDKIISIDNGYYFSDGDIYITIKHSKYGTDEDYDFIGNDNTWTNQINRNYLVNELYSYYKYLKKELKNV